MTTFTTTSRATTCPMDVDASPSSWSLLLSLPAELRNDVYQTLLSAAEPIDISKPTAQPSLTKVCRQVQYESLAWYYARNVFAVSVCNGNLSELVDFACRTPAEALWIMRDYGRLRVQTKYTSIYDMPISQSAVEWRQPLTKTTEPVVDFIFEQHMHRRGSAAKDEETGRVVLTWLLQPDVLDQLRQERRMGPTFADMCALKLRTEAQLQSVAYGLC